MNGDGRVTIRQLPTGVPGLDQVLGGGLPEFSFNLIAGPPGSGKTTLAQQVMFSLATPERPALHFTVPGEPPLKVLRYQQQFDFFDPAKVDSGAVRFRNLSEAVLNGGLEAVLESITEEVELANPALVVVDSFRTITRAGEGNDLQTFVQTLALKLTTWEATTFLIGDYESKESESNPIFTVTDGILWLYQATELHATVRKLQVVKQRGQAAAPGLHSFRITDAGVHVFPRLLEAPEAPRARGRTRLSTGVEGLDGMMEGGIPEGDSVLVDGPSGCGKTTLAIQFVTAGIEAGENAVLAIFEEYPYDYARRAANLGLEVEELVEQGRLEVVYLRPLDLSADETLYELRQAAERIGATRLVIDSLSGFEIALASGGRGEFRESLYRLVGTLTGIGITVMMTVEVTGNFTQLSLGRHSISFLADDIVLLRYVEIDGELRRVLNVIKMRRSGHSPAVRAYRMTGEGLEVGEIMDEYRGLITGVPERRPRERTLYPRISGLEHTILRALRDGEASAAEVARRESLDAGEAAEALERLVTLGYVLPRQGDGGVETLYRTAGAALAHRGEGR